MPPQSARDYAIKCSRLRSGSRAGDRWAKAAQAVLVPHRMSLLESCQATLVKSKEVVSATPFGAAAMEAESKAAAAETKEAEASRVRSAAAAVAVAGALNAATTQVKRIAKYRGLNSLSQHHLLPAPRAEPRERSRSSRARSVVRQRPWSVASQGEAEGKEGKHK